MPSNLQSPTFGYRFDQGLEGVMLPSNLQPWTYGHAPTGVCRCRPSATRSTRAWKVLRCCATCRPCHAAEQPTDIDNRPRSACLPDQRPADVTFGCEFDQNAHDVTLHIACSRGPLTSESTRTGRCHVPGRPADIDLQLQVICLADQQPADFDLRLQVLPDRAQWDVAAQPAVVDVWLQRLSKLLDAILPSGPQTLTFGYGFNLSS